MKIALILLLGVAYRSATSEPVAGFYPFYPRQQNIMDLGYPYCGAGWFDIQEQGVKHDYCRWVGNCGCRGSCSFWSCALAGSDKQYTPKGQYFEQDLDETVEFISNGDAGIDLGKRMGTYTITGQLVRGFPVYEQNIKKLDRKQLLFVGPHGNWRVGPDTTTWEGSALKNTQRSGRPPRTGWQYRHRGKWIKDDYIEAIINVKSYVWNESQNIFTDEQCPNIGNNPGLDISACKKKCHDTPTCSAINVRIDGVLDCVLRDCFLPVPKPYWQMSGYKSYFKKILTGQTDTAQITPPTAIKIKATYHVSGTTTEQVTAAIGSTLWTDRPEYIITKMPEELVGSTLFQPKYHVDKSTIVVFSSHKARIWVGVYQNGEGGLMDVLSKQGWRLEDGWFVEWNLGEGKRLNKIWTTQIEAGQSITFTTTNNGMTFVIFVSEEICTAYTPLSDSWRHINYTHPIRGYYQQHCDMSGSSSWYTNLTHGWYRFTGPAGTKLPTANDIGGDPSLGKRICGTYATGWILSGDHPTMQDGIVSRDVCFLAWGDSCYKKNTIKVAACRDQHGEYFVYELQPVPNCNRAYCAID